MLHIFLFQVGDEIIIQNVTGRRTRRYMEKSA